MSAATGPRLGALATLNFNNGTNATYNTPVWTQVIHCRDLTMGHAMDSADVSRKGTGGVKQQEPTLLDLDLQFEILEVPADNLGFVAIRSAYFGRTVLDTSVCTGVMNTGNGELYTRADYKVFEFKESQPIDGINAWSITMKPCFSTNPVVNGTN
jgi:hypothetical protein